VKALLSEPLDVVILSPIFPPAPGGGAQYSQFLIENLPQLDVVARVQAYTESWPGMPRAEKIEGRGDHADSEVVRNLVRFYGFPNRVLRRYPAYFLQNIQIAHLLRSIAKRARRNTVALVHSAFFAHPSLLVYSSRRLKALWGNNFKLVLDCRDPSIPHARLRQFAGFHAAISCSERLTRELELGLPSSVPITEIPVPMTFGSVARAEVQATLEKYQLKEGGYLFTPNGIKDVKGFPLIFDTWKELSRHFRSLDLVVAGDTRDWAARYGETDRHFGKLVNIGPISNESVRALMKGSAAVVNVSQSEGLPRTCLESISLDAPTLLPPGIPEFGRIDKIFKAESKIASEIAEQVRQLIEGHLVPPYDYQRHSADKILLAYDDFLQSLVGPAAGSM
jgi:glycosyltransferase involved in cell wall biosynthesis